MKPAFTEVAPGIHCWSDTCNVYVIKDGSAAILIDLGDGSVLDALPQLGVTQVEWVLYTHHQREKDSPVNGSSSGHQPACRVGYHSEWMSIAGSSSIRRLEDFAIESAPGRSRHESVGGPRAGEIGGGSSGSPMACARRVVGAGLLIDVTAASRGVVGAIMPAARS